MSTLLVIVPARDAVRGDAPYHLIVAETGECLATHICSHHGFAFNDLYGCRPERKEEWSKRFGDVDVKFIDDTDISEEELIIKNHTWYNSEKEKQENI